MPRCYLIAEISANHNGQLDTALEIVRLAAESGADAVKIQTYTADTMTLDCDAEPFIVQGGTLWDGQKLYDLYAQAHTPWDWHQAIFDEAAAHGLECFSSPFDATAVDFLEQFNPAYHKVASFELTDHPLLQKIASTGRKVIMSTGMSTLEEIEESVQVLREGGCPEITLLKCTSSYPAPADEANLVRIADMAQRFGVRTGLSDHTMGATVPIAAVALGAQVIEKHFCRSRSEPGPDSAFSMEPHEFKAMAEAIRITEKAIGSADYSLTKAEEKSLRFRRSLFASRDIAAGEKFTPENVRVIRPGDGLAPKNLPSVLGKTASCDIPFGTPLSTDHLG
ncbi:pseudaminic acid synthase [Akkermansiaceae bacterium]|nr:pseudaminic acid synthase [Akkermansiaceae bacterium]MDB4283831.1 pseudaminic acid synthase [Akkermansiaceae bacterium]MDB4506884.1 pseudaminic acid synthase [Akkermansiaceae bacterium]MDB4668032.1 pseudaminic acid synthase [Akkermansiaceae bacterium]MDC0265191.1 pseudaminic acid synthase [bacterium]